MGVLDPAGLESCSHIWFFIQLLFQDTYTILGPTSGHTEVNVEWPQYLSA